MNQLTKLFNGQRLRVIENNNEPWFVAKDVAEILGYSDTAKAIRVHCKGADEMSIPSNGGMQKMKIIPERDVYRLVMRSKLPAAEQFEEWVVAEVLPSIRKTGQYSIEKPSYMYDDPIKRAERWISERKEFELLEQQRKAELPYTNFGKVVANSDGAINIGTFAKMLYDEHGITLGRNKLFGWLRDNGYLIKSGRERNNPKQKYVDNGWFTVSVTLINRTEGAQEKLTPMITGKGQVSLSEKLIKEFGGVSNERAI